MEKTMSTPDHFESHAPTGAIAEKVNGMIEEMISSLPDPKHLTAAEQRGIIARYTAVLEGNFIYWMTAAYLAVKAEAARPHLIENLHEEVRDAHPAMLRRFAMAAHAFPTDADALAVNEDLNKMRVFLGRLSGVQSLAAMAYLADLAVAQGSADMEYTDVHGVCDIAHTAGLFEALDEEMAVNPLSSGQDILEGVYLLRNLLNTVVFNAEVAVAA
jgi:hypothetical protein